MIDPSLYSLPTLSSNSGSSYLDIQKIEFPGKPATWKQPPKWTIGDRVEPYGNALTIKLPEPLTKGDEVSVDVC